jgi:hypothetical protein
MHEHPHEEMSGRETFSFLFLFLVRSAAKSVVDMTESVAPREVAVTAMLCAALWLHGRKYQASRANWIIQPKEATKTLNTRNEVVAQITGRLIDFASGLSPVCLPSCLLFPLSCLPRRG